MKRELCAAVVAMALSAGAALAGDAVDRLFAPGALEQVDRGTVLGFTRTRAVPEDADLAAIEKASLEIEIGDDRATVRFDIDGRPQSFAHPLGAAHPLLLLFLETSHKSVADLSGGSPFYIKNRIVQSFGRAQVSAVETPSGAGEKLVVKPFAHDPNRIRMGDYAELEIAFVMTDGVPGGLYSATAAAGAYTESVIWTGDGS